MKTHLSLPTRQLELSIDFYRVLLDVEPAKRYEDYALFISDQPPLELALHPAADPKPDASAHFGIAVDAPEAVEAATQRLRAAALPLDIETGEICCYARQDKVWASDPDGRCWEVYYVLEETEARGDADVDCCAGQTSCCAPAAAP